MNSYTKLLTDLVNVNVKIDEEDKAVILLNSLPEEEYETFTLTLINGRQSLNYNLVSTALVNYDVRSQDRLSSSGSITAEALAVRDRSSNRKGRDDQGRSKSRSGFRDLKKNQCALCRELRHWKVYCRRPKVRRSQKLKQISHRWSVLMPVLHRQMDQTQTHHYFLSLLLLLLLVTQIILSGS